MGKIKKWRMEMFRKNKKNYDNWREHRPDEHTKFLVKIVMIGLAILTAVFLFIFFGIKEPQGYGDEIAIENEKDVIRNEVEKVEREEAEKIVNEIKNKEIYIEAHKRGQIMLKPMLDTASAELYTELKPLPIENSYGDNVSIKLKENCKTPSDRTIKLSKEDVERLQGYKVWSKTKDLEGNLTVDPNYKSFEDMYKNRKDICKFVNKAFHPEMFSYYKYAEVDWITSDNLIYQTPLSQYAVRGIIKLKYYRANNRYHLKTDKWYERDVEYKLSFTTDGNFINEIIYLTDWKEVK